MNVQPAVLGCVGEMLKPLLESREVFVDLVDRGRVVKEDSRHELERVCVPVLDHARLLEH